MKIWSMILVILGLAMTQHNKLVAQMANPLLEEFNTPFGVPPFNLIKEQHYIPAIQKAMEMQNQEIEAIINEKAPTFENVYERFERSGHALSKVTSIFYNLSSAHTNPELQRIAKEVAPLLSAHNDNIYLNERLYAKLIHMSNMDEMETKKQNIIKEITALSQDGSERNRARAENLRIELKELEQQAVMQSYEKLQNNLTDEQKRLAEEIQKKFKRSGSDLTPSSKDRLKEINGRLALLSVQFGENVLKDINDYVLLVNKKKDLSGLPKPVIEAAKETAKAKKMKGYAFTLSPPSMQPFLQYADNRALRQQIMEANLSKGASHPERMNADIIVETVRLRHEKAQLLGYRTHADYVLENSMSKTPANVMSFLNQIWEPALKMVNNEAIALQDMIREEGGSFELASWDWAYYTEKLRKKKYDLDGEALRPYFELENVKQGMFDVIQKLWGLQFKPLKNVPVYQEDVVAYEVLEADGSHIGVIYMDFFPRDSKRGGAWMSSFRKQSYEGDKRIAPVVTIVCNFTKPSGKEPSLLTLREVETLYHEMGHALHGLLSDVKYAELSGTAVPRDFVELPSQIMENWATERVLLEKNAKHYKTGAPIPAELLDKMELSSKFNMGFTSAEYLAASFLDMNFHSETSSVGVRPELVEFKVTARLKLPEYIPFRYKSTYFNHIFSGGYSAGYYSYIYSEILDADAYGAFLEIGDIFSPKVARSFRENILSKGNADDPAELYRRFRGKDPDIRYLLERRGFN